ncbi:MAG: SAM-dependent methyltransferase [Candidatus Phytoplasma pruni]|nr:SAM-dependent methyltransferase [Candidatus Phytoplasma pruni]
MMKRIDFIASLLQGYHTVVDVGTDHGLVLKKAFEQGYIQKAIASDINPQPLEKARENLENYLVEFYLSDGFENIPSSFDLALIAGMGPYTIIHILEKTSHIGKPFILGCQGKIHLLVEWLKRNYYTIQNHYIVHDKFNYMFLKVIRNK